MQSEAVDPIDGAVDKRRAELAEMPINEVRQEFESMFGIRADLSVGKENLIDRVLAKVRAELRRAARTASPLPFPLPSMRLILAGGSIERAPAEQRQPDWRGHFLRG